MTPKKKRVEKKKIRAWGLIHNDRLTFVNLSRGDVEYNKDPFEEIIPVEITYTPPIKKQ